jgi:hypothetical protein
MLDACGDFAHGVIAQEGNWLGGDILCFFRQESGGLAYRIRVFGHSTG